MQLLHPVHLPLWALLSCAVSADFHHARGGVDITTKTAVTCGRKTRKGDRLKVDYVGKLQSTGIEFDNSYERGQPFTFTLGKKQVIKGWDIALLGMCPGEERELIIPPELAYGHRGNVGIPPDSTLIFDTKLVEIIGVEQPAMTTTIVHSSANVVVPTSAALGAVSTASLPAQSSAAPVVEDLKEPVKQPVEEPVDGGKDSPLDGAKPKKRCQLLGPFALMIQGALGGFAILTLVFKRYRERPQRPWKIWFFDVSKQVFGSMLTHVLNVGMSMLSSVKLAHAAEKFGTQAQAQNDMGHYPNPCSFYLLNLAIDTTLGIPVLWLLLIVIHALALRTPLARPPQSITSGSYGQPPRWTWYLKQLLIYFIGLTGMKFAVFLLFTALPWLPWIGDWALRWTEGNEKLEIAFAMFIFPLAMNAVQYYIIDNLIMDKKRDEVGYQAVQEDDEHAPLARDGSATEVGDEDGSFKLDDEEDGKAPSPMGSYESGDAPQSSLLRTQEDVSRKLK